jgi:DNA-binding transcriptional ArsR family regulator
VGERSAAVLDRVFSAVSDPTRRAILERLADSDARVTDLAGAFPISLNSTSKHIRVLEGAGLVRRTVRGREHILSLEVAPLAEAADWIAHYRRFWSERLAALDAFVTRGDPGPGGAGGAGAVTSDDGGGAGADGAGAGGAGAGGATGSV